MTGIVTKEMTSTPAREARRRDRRRPLDPPYAPPHRPRRPGRPFPMGDSRHEPPRARVLGLGNHGRPVPGRVCQTSHRPPAHAGRAAPARSRALGSGRDLPRHRLRVRRRPHRGLDEHPRRDRRGTACICGDVIYDVQNQIVDPIYQVLDYEPQSTGNQGTSKRQERAAIKKALNSGDFVLPIHDLPARVEHGRVVSRLVATPCRGRSSRRAPDGGRDAEDGPRPRGVLPPSRSMTCGRRERAGLDRTGAAW